jgi:2'-5' RNA ligase
MKRTFIAVKIVPGDHMLDIFRRFREGLSREKIKWVDPNAMHITLCFLGDTEEEKIPHLKNEIKKAVSSFPPLTLVFHGCGLFKSYRDPRVIWFGMRESDTLKELRRSLDEVIEPFGFIPEKREFRPHLTMARIKWIRNIPVLEDLIEEYRDESIQQSAIHEVIFYESILKKEGPEYIPLLNATLDGLAKKR